MYLRGSFVDDGAATERPRPMPWLTSKTFSDGSWALVRKCLLLENLVAVVAVEVVDENEASKSVFALQILIFGNLLVIS